MSEIWLDLRTVTELTGLSNRAIQRQAQAREIRWRYRPHRGRNGKRAREYSLASLPPGAQLTYAHHAGLVPLPPDNAPRVLPPPTSEKQISLFTLPAPIPKEFRTPLTNEQKAEVDHRAAAIGLMVEFAQQTNGHRPSVTLQNGLQIRTLEECARWIAAQHADCPQCRGLSRTTIWRWFSSFQRKGPAGLLDPPRRDKGTSRFFGSPSNWKYPVVAKFALAKYAEGLSVAYITDAIAREWKRFSLSGVRPPCYDTVNGLLMSVPKPVRDVARLSEQECNAKNAPFLLTDIASVRVNEIWVSDHRVYDVLVQNDCFPRFPTLARMRVWETAIEDMRSRAIVGAVWAATPSSRTIASALRLAITRFGLPEIFYCDNGKDFRKIGRSAQIPLELDEEGRVQLDPSASDLLRRLGIQAKYCIPRHPQSKQIESYFSTVAGRFDVIFGAAYAGPKPHLRPDACREAEKRHAAFLKGKRADSPLPLASEFIALAKFWTEEFNRTHRHGGLGMDNRTPYQVMDELLPPDKRRMIDIVQLADLFWERQDRVVSNATVQLGGHTYCGADPESAQAMYLANGSTVRVAFDSDNDGPAIAYELGNGEPIARLECQQLVARGPESREAIQSMTRGRNRLRRASKHFWRVASAGVPSELELLRERAGLPLEGPRQPQLPSTIEADTDVIPRGARAVGSESLSAEEIARRFLERRQRNGAQ